MIWHHLLQIDKFRQDKADVTFVTVSLFLGSYMCFLLEVSMSWMLEKSLNCVASEKEFWKWENKIGTVRTRLRIGVLCQKRLNDVHLFCKN